jgi:hypothetical protein
MSRRLWNKLWRDIAPQQPTLAGPRRRTARPAVEQLEEMVLPSSTTLLPAYLVGTAHKVSFGPQSGQTPDSAALTPTQVRTAYGIGSIAFQTSGSSVTGDGSGQIIAIVDAYDNPNINSDLDTFNTQYTLPSRTSSNFVKIGISTNGTGSTSTFPSRNSGWSGESSLDVEWAHAVAPGAKILLIEAHSASDTDLLNAIDYARNYTDPGNGQGVAAISMSWGANEFFGETSDDSHFTTPSGHSGISFFGSSGDSGTPIIWPAVSSHVIGVGGTTLSVSSSGAYQGESGWSGSGGGISAYVSQPSYQSNLTISNGNSTISAGGMRAGPDVAYNADTSSGVSVYSSYGFGGWATVGGTSAGSPQWAALMSIVDQGLSLAGKSALDGYSQTLPALYQLPSSDFHDITSGYNGYSAGTGFDLVTGLGSPVANRLVADLVGSSTAQAPTVSGSLVSGSATPTSVGLTATGTAPTGDSLTFAWTATGPAAVSFSPNANSQTVTANFSQAGNYTFTVTATDTTTHLTASSQVTFTVNQVVGAVSVSPSSTTVATGGTRQFSASATDQFGATYTGALSVTWSIDAGGVGSIDTATGLYSALTTPGTATVRATTGTTSGTASVTVAALGGPSITTPAYIVSQSATSATLSVGASDPAGTSSLTYSWLETSGPSTFFFAGGSNTAQTPTVNFTGLGTYQFTVTVTDPSNLTAASTVTVTVGQVLTTITVTPGSMTLAGGATQQFAAAGSDQFGGAMALSSVAWSATGGTITTAGFYTAPSASGGYTVQAVSSGVTGNATVTVPAAAGATLFSDNFENGAGQWQLHSGYYYLWTTGYGSSRNTRLLVINVGDFSRIEAGSLAWTNYSLQGTVTFQNNYGGGSVALLGRVVDDFHLYWFGYDSTLHAWTIARKSSPSGLTTLAVGPQYGVAYGQNYIVRADMNGSSLSLYVNGVLETTATDSTYFSGQIGFSAVNAAGTLDNVTVTALNGGATRSAGGTSSGSGATQTGSHLTVTPPAWRSDAYGVLVTNAGSGSGSGHGGRLFGEVFDPFWEFSVRF